MSGYTPGPWFVSECGFSMRNPVPTVYAVDTDPRYIAHCDDCLNFGEPTDNLANAYLIAAAPDLLDQHEADMVDLDLLAKAIHAGDPMPELVIRVTDMLNRKRAAIAKATGEQS